MVAILYNRLFGTSTTGFLDSGAFPHGNATPDSKNAYRLTKRITPVWYRRHFVVISFKKIQRIKKWGWAIYLSIIFKFSLEVFFNSKMFFLTI